jgi:quercetin dioxygenase-like cupin family protein
MHAIYPLQRPGIFRCQNFPLRNEQKSSSDINSLDHSVGCLLLLPIQWSTPIMQKVLIAALACLSLTGCVNTPVVSDPPAPTAIERHVLTQSSSSWDGAPYKAYPEGGPELSVLKISLPANSALPWHSHPIPNAAYVLKGEITIELEGGRSQVFKQGEVFPEVVDTRHRGKTGPQPTELLIFYAGSEGIPLQH